MVKNRILIYQIGSIGDTLSIVPVLFAIRQKHSQDNLIFFTDKQENSKIVSTKEILKNSNLVDIILEYKYNGKLFGKIINILSLLIYIVKFRKQKYQKCYYLIHSKEVEKRVRRDKFFFKLAGIKNIVGEKGLITFPDKIKNIPLPFVPNQTEQLLRRLKYSGIELSIKKNQNYLNIGELEKENVDRWIDLQSAKAKGKWIGIGIGGKTPVNIWPYKRYLELVEKLLIDYDLWPVVFGGAEDVIIARNLIDKWGKGYVAAGTLGIREGIACLSKCVLFIGNDTGTLHMAGLANIPCIGIYSSHAYPGEWYINYEKFVALRTQIECEGCRLHTCITNNMKCILSITVDQVHNQAVKMLSQCSQNNPIYK